MGKIKAATISERFGFRDEDLKTPKHDEIMIWLDENLNDLMPLLSTLWSKLERNSDKWIQGEIEHLRRGDFNGIKKDVEVKVNEPLSPSGATVLRKEWEFPIMDRTYVIGFIDMLVTTEFNGWMLQAHVPSPYVRREKNMQQLAFEVKTTIPSLGELLRQINHYRAYFDEVSTEFVVVSPDTRWKEMLERNSVYFLEYPRKSGSTNLFSDDYEPGANG